MQEFQVQKTDLHKTKIVDVDSAPLKDGEVRAKVDLFSFTANNITYGVAGDQIGYWQFFPAHGAEGQGLLPVWGFADISESKHADVPVGERLYGYFPPAEELVLSPVGMRAGQFIDGAEHRSALPQGYNVYRRVNAEPGYNGAFDEARALLFPLHVTSFCLWDCMKDNDWYGAEQVIVVSASSKTSIGLGFALHEDADAPISIGLTSGRNASFVKSLGYYDQTATYDDLSSIDISKPTVIVDMSGNGDVLGALHASLGANMKHCLNVGLTHWEEGAANKNIIKERSEFFFAPGHIQKRIGDWGAEGFTEKSNDFLMKSMIASKGWMKVREANGLEGLSEHYQAVCDGKFAPDEGLIVRF
ncbi:DUF2855 family protein [Ponticaulis koreensis]|uniref:DUF2855 family protein n=1 Tax=Ponticaulis koreensis TaxID=1123045 RepID=UPI0003B6B84A|nr:DUF2855 family protein [Ponticaulis koreensis]